MPKIAHTKVPSAIEQYVGSTRLMLQVLEANCLQALVSLFALADHLVEAKVAYEEETKTGQGKRNPQQVASFVEVMAQQLGRSSSTVQNYLNIARLTEAERDALADAGIDLGIKFLVELSRQSDAERAETIRLAVTEGKEAAKKALRSKAKVKALPPKTETSVPVETDEGSGPEVEVESAPTSSPAKVTKVSPKSVAKATITKTVTLPKNGKPLVVEGIDPQIRLHIAGVTADAVEIEVELVA